MKLWVQRTLHPDGKHVYHLTGGDPEHGLRIPRFLGWLLRWRP